MSEQTDEIADRLESIAEELASAAIDELRGAVQRREQRRPANERVLTQARRAVEKAAHLLRNIDGDEEPDDVSS